MAQTRYFQAIETRWLGPTNTRPSRIVARADAGRIVVSWDYALTIAENHRKAAEALCNRLRWSGELIGGNLPGARMAWVFAPDSTF